MNLEEAFLADVVAHPHDATPWLVFADWLEERDDRRGELVRLWQQTHQQPGHPDLDEWHARIEELFATGLRLPLPRHVNALGMELVWVPPGAFWMGGSDGKCGDKLVEMRQPFYLGVQLVTQGQWRALMGDNPGNFSRSGYGHNRVQDISDADLDSFPIETVAMSSVQAFLGRLNESERGSGWEYRLPTEEQWEYACRSPLLPQPAKRTAPSPSTSTSLPTVCRPSRPTSTATIRSTLPGDALSAGPRKWAPMARTLSASTTSTETCTSGPALPVAYYRMSRAVYGWPGAVAGPPLA
jgi:uncharacterized protein (TIGR02996 family)